MQWYILYFAGKLAFEKNAIVSINVGKSSGDRDASQIAYKYWATLGTQTLQHWAMLIHAEIGNNKKIRFFTMLDNIGDLHRSIYFDI